MKPKKEDGEMPGVTVNHFGEGKGHKTARLYPLFLLREHKAAAFVSFSHMVTCTRLDLNNCKLVYILKI